MRFRSAEFDQAIISGATIVATAELFRGEESLKMLPVIDGSWSEDDTALVRSSSTLTLGAENPEDIVPAKKAGSLDGLWPTGNEFQLRCGIRYPDGSEELLNIGRYRISKPKAQRSVDGGVLVTVDAYDRGRSLQRARFTKPYGIRPNTDYAEAIQTLVKDRMPYVRNQDFVFMRTDGTGGSRNYKTPLLIFMDQEDPLEQVHKMAASIGAEFFFDDVGRPTLRPILPPSATSVVWDYQEDEFSLVTDISRTLDDEQSYNGVIAFGTSSTTPNPPRAEAWDTNPLSPTYYDPARPAASIYGPVPYFMASEFIVTQAQARDAARGNLQKEMGTLENVEFSAVPHFAHQAGDVVRLGYPEVGVDEIYVLQSFSCGITHTGGLSATTRRRQLS